LNPERDGVKFPLVMRVPAGDGQLYSVSVNGEMQRRRFIPKKDAGYCVLERAWNKGDRVTLNLPVLPKLVLGKSGDEGRAAIVRGPLVLALDAELNPGIGALNRVALVSNDVKTLDLRLEPEKSHRDAPVFSALATIGADVKPVRIYLAPFATAGEDGKSKYSVWIALPGHAAAEKVSASVFSGAASSASRAGNREGDITDDDPDTFVVTYNGTKQSTDWFAVSTASPVTIDRVVYMHGHCFHDGGWFNASASKPQIEAQKVKGGPWIPLGVLDSYPSTSATEPAGLTDGQPFELRFGHVSVVAIRVIGTPACGDNPAQSFSSCAELQAFAGRL
jgi:hypothetical protein